MTRSRSMLPEKVRSLGSLFRRSSGSSTSSVTEQQQASQASPTPDRAKRPSSARSKSSFIIPRLPPSIVRETVPEENDTVPETVQSRAPDRAPGPEAAGSQHLSSIPDTHPRLDILHSPRPLPTPEPSPQDPSAGQQDGGPPVVTLQLPSPPDQQQASAIETEPASDSSRPARNTSKETATTPRAEAPRSIETGSRTRPLSAAGRSLLESRPRSPLYQTLLAREHAASTEHTAENQAIHQTVKGASKDYEPNDYFSTAYTNPQQSPSKMAQSPTRYTQAHTQHQPQQPSRKRRIWVKRPGASATLVAINEDDMVDDARDMILRKYANSLGKSFDSPDVTLRIHPREHQISASQRSNSGQQATPSPLQEERVLRPDEVLSRTLDVYFPGGQSVEEALLIDVPQPVQRSRRTPRHSPGLLTSHHGAYAVHYEDTRPTESDKDYFPPVGHGSRGTSGAHSPGVIAQLPVIGPGNHPHSIAVINGGPLPALPSPGTTERGIGGMPGSARRRHTGRPSYGRQHTSSPTIVQTSSAEARPNIAAATQPPPPPIGTPPHPAPGLNLARTATPPPPRVSSPRPTKPSKRAAKKQSTGGQSTLTPGPSGLLATVPPINVLVVEDNIINLKLLEAFLKRLKVRYQSAMNGRDAVKKWRKGGFHLVLMDIQLPLMNGLEATKEIRRLEKVNDVGAFVKSAEEELAEKGRQTMEAALGKNKDPPEPVDEEKEREKNLLGDRELFKSPVIIVALTASSLHSDRSEALAAGCNDFLTKPVNLNWLERKLKEWGCMQALIDFEGWKQWKDFNQAAAPATVASQGGKANQPTASSLSNLKTAQTSSKPVPSSTNPLAATSGTSAPPASNPVASALRDLNAKADSQESTKTLDSVASDDSLSTTIAARVAPSVSVQGPTPRQSVEGAEMPRVDTGSGNNSVSPSKGGFAASPRSATSTGDGSADGRDRSSERRRRGNRSSLGGLQAVAERDGEEGRNDGEVQVGA